MTYVFVFKPFEKMVYIVHVQTSIFSLKISEFNVITFSKTVILFLSLQILAVKPLSDG